MKLVKTQVENLTRRMEADGLFTVSLHYKASDATGEMDYTGPKIPKEMWQQVLSFFKWTFDTTGSESQVRLFVSPKLKQWKAWAFPQQAEMGLSTKELSNDDAKKQRAELFENDDDWTAWGTVHHHCSIGAFQSGTDETDEKSVGGIHITVGNMDKPHHSIHCRLYHQGDLYEPDMSKLWDIGEVMSHLPEELFYLLSEAAPDKIARSQMCIPSSAPFPDQWKMNFIRVEKKVTVSDSHLAWDRDDRHSFREEPIGTRKEIAGTLWEKTHQGWESVGNDNKVVHRRGRANLQPFAIRTAVAWDDLAMALAVSGVENDQEMLEMLEEMLQGDVGDVVKVCKENDIVLEDLVDEGRMRLMDESKGLTSPEAPNGYDNPMD